MKKIFIGVILALIIGCAPRKTAKVVTPKNEYDIYENDNNKKSNNSGTNVHIVVEPNEVDTNSTTPTTSEVVANRAGYRVQVYAFSSQESAENAAAQVRIQVSEPVYVEFVDGLYKVRVGDFTSRIQAETVRDRLRSMGYPDAFLVETSIR